MKVTEAQYRRIEAHLPRQRGNVSISNLQVLNAILYVAEHGCKWRGLPKLKFLAISGSKQAFNAVGITFSVFGSRDFCRHVNRAILLDTALECVAY